MSALLPNLHIMEAGDDSPSRGSQPFVTGIVATWESNGLVGGPMGSFTYEQLHSVSPHLFAHVVRDVLHPSDDYTTHSAVSSASAFPVAIWHGPRSSYRFVDQCQDASQIRRHVQAENGSLALTWSSLTKGTCMQDQKFPALTLPAFCCGFKNKLCIASN